MRKYFIILGAIAVVFYFVYDFNISQERVNRNKEFLKKYYELNKFVLKGVVIKIVEQDNGDGLITLIKVSFSGVIDYSLDINVLENAADNYIFRCDSRTDYDLKDTVTIDTEKRKITIIKPGGKVIEQRLSDGT
jgi:hypothetical protein